MQLSVRIGRQHDQIKGDEVGGLYSMHGRKLWTEFIWLRIGTSGGLL